MNEEQKLCWLIRDHTNVIRGPYRQAEVLQLIKRGQLKGKTELSQANSYWFALDEKSEVGRFFPELGLKVAEQPTQMTATLTQAEVVDHGLEATQVVKTTAPEPTAGSGNDEIQWLSSEFAEEFGEDRPLDMVDPMSRSTVKDDTMPSEEKDYQGDRPRPLGNFSHREKTITNTNLVKVAVEKPGGAKILPVPAAGLVSGKSVVIGVGALLCAGAVFVAGLHFSKIKSIAPSASPRVARKNGSALVDLRRALILFDLEAAKGALADFELEPAARGQIDLPVAQALMKREFLFDLDGALQDLQQALGAGGAPAKIAEVKNLDAVYRFERNPGDSIDEFRDLTESAPGEAMFRYNLALAHLRHAQFRESLAAAARMPAGEDRALTEGVSLLQAWAKDAQSKGTEPSVEAAYLKTLELNPFSAKARLGLAIHRLRKGGLKASESDFRAFLDLAPELDSPAEVVSYRRLNDLEFYHFARSQLRDLNVPLGAAGAKPSALIMAVDAVLSCVQNRTGEAGKILEGALSAAPGDASILMAAGYVRFKEGRHEEVIDLLKDITPPRPSYGIGVLLGKSFVKVGREELAEKQFTSTTQGFPGRSEGWSMLGYLQLQRGHEGPARKNLQNALQKNPRDIIALRGLDRIGENVLSREGLARNLPF